MNNYHLLLKKLDEFIRKYYVNQLIKGGLFTTAIILLLFLTVSSLEYYFYFEPITRKALFYSFLLISAGILIKFIAIPAVKYFKLGNIIDHTQAAHIIGNHFEDVQDKLLNILQLNEQLSDNKSDSYLIRASIDQKIGEIKPLPFQSIIKLKDNVKYLKYALPPLFILIILLFTSPSLIRESTYRLINNDQYFEKPAPFRFMIMNDKLSVMQYENFDLKVTVEGKVLPAQVYVEEDGQRYLLNKKSSNTFSYTFNNLNEDLTFYLSANGLRSSGYTLKVKPKPVLSDFDVTLDYPAYTGKKDEVIHNTGDLVIPEGTNIQWNFSTRNADLMELHFSDSMYHPAGMQQNTFSFTKRVYKSQPYYIKVANKVVKSSDSIAYAIQSIPDRYPDIEVRRFKDSADYKKYYFLGEAEDDYGLSKISLRYFKESESKSETKEKAILSGGAGKLSAGFSHVIDHNDFDLKPGEKMVYYFEVWDNDAINGSKSARSKYFTYSLPSEEEYHKEKEERNDKIRENLSKTKESAENLKKKINDIKSNILQKENMTWEDKEKIKEVLEEQKKLENQVKKVQENMKKNLQQQSDYEEISEEVLKKQEKLNQFMEDVFSEEMKEMMDKLQKMLEELNKQQSLEELENMEMSNEQFEMELDRMLSLFKQLEFEQKLSKAIEDLEKLKNKQDDLLEETEEANKNEMEELSDKQKKLEKEYQAIEDQINETEKLSKELNMNSDFSDTEKSRQEIQKNMQQSSSGLQQKNKNDARQKQQNAKEEMKKLGESLKAMQQQMQMEQMQIDLRAIRQLLENLINLSFEQEEIVNKTKTTRLNSPEFKKNVQNQYELKENINLVQDSLIALSKRLFQIESFVNKEVYEVNKHLKKTIRHLEERQIGPAASRQQYVMTGLNNLALMLSEIMEQMHQQMANKMPGQQMCQNPKNQGKGQKMPNLSKMQEQLNKQMEQLYQQMKDGDRPKGELSKKLAQMAEKQAQIRKELEKMNQGKQNQGKGKDGELDDAIKKMDDTENDIVNKKISRELLQRQQEIMTRLLNFEKAEREQETEKKRKAESPDEIENTVPASVEKYLKEKEAQVEFYKKLPPELKPYYKLLVKEYFKNLN